MSVEYWQSEDGYIDRASKRRAEDVEREKGERNSLVVERASW